MTSMSALHHPRPEPVCPEALGKRICVRPPYFALETPEWDNQTFSATGPVQLPRGGERSPMAAAEVGRHAAIAGLCSAALTQRDDARRYYLAQRAHYTGFTPRTEQGAVHFESKLQHLDKRAACSLVRVFAGGGPLAEVTVNYTVLSAGAFERLFRDRARPASPETTRKPYTGELSGRLERAPETLRLYVEAVPAEVCAGHFDGFPAMPVAVLMSQLSRLAGELMEGVPYHVTAGLIDADDLLWAGSAAMFEAVRTSRNGKEHRFHCSSYAAGRVKGQMALTFVEA